MGIDDKAKNAASDLAGKAKEAQGELTDDEAKRSEGKKEQSKAHLKQAAENVKDAFK